MSRGNLVSRLFRRPPNVSTFWQWLAWRTRRNWRKMFVPVHLRMRELRHAVRRTARCTVLPDVTFTVQPSLADPVTEQIVHYGVWEPVETAIMLRLLAPGMTVVDIGANLGYHAVIASRMVGPGGRVIAFEPEPRNHALLTDNLRRNHCANVEAHRKAVSDETGRSVTLYLAADNLGDHRIFPDPEEAGRGHATVVTTTVDAVVDGAPVHFVKMDIQGAEGHALAGMEQTLRGNDDIVILFEFWPYGLRRASTTPEHVLENLAAAGFDLRVARQAVDLRDSTATLTDPATSREILALVSEERFDQTLNLVARRDAAAVRAL